MDEESQIASQLAQLAAETPPQNADDRQIVEQLTAAEQQEIIENDAQSHNLAESLDAELLRQIGEDVWTGFDEDSQSRAEWLQQHTFWLSLYMQQDYAENSDAERSWGATESIPILAEACDQFQARTYKSFFPNDTFISAVPMRRSTGDQSKLEERSKRIGHHMSYQLGYEDRTYKRDKDALFLGCAVHGSFFTKTYFNAKLKRFKVDNVRPTDLVVNYHVGPIHIEDLRRKTHIIYSTVGETEDLVNQGFFIQAARPAQSVQDNPYNWTVNETQGLTSTGNSRMRRDMQAVLLEQHVYLDLGDGVYHPYIVTVCAASHKVLRLVIGYEAAPDGTPLDDFKQIQYFTHYKYKENPDGFYGLGLGHSIGDLNSAANIMLRQAMDAATLANDGNMSGFISDRLGIEGNQIRCTLGEFTKIPDNIGEFQNSIMMMKFPGPNESLIKLMQAIDARAQRLGSTTEATTGTPNAVQQPTTYLAEIEQAMEAFSAAQLRLANSFSEELQKIFRINQRYMPLVTYFTVNNVPESVTREDYKDDMLVQPVFDPKFATQAQKVARAQAELNATMQNPNNQGRPQVYDEAFKRYFEALDVADVDALIPPPLEPASVDNQIWENAQFLMPGQSRELFDVFPEHDHAVHLAQLEQFVAENGHLLVDPDQLQAIKIHKMKHESYLYAQKHGLIPPPAPGQERPSPLAGGFNNPMGNGSAPDAVPDMASLLAAPQLGGSQPQGGATAGA